MDRRPRVVVYVRKGRELLVFEHRDHPEAGTQVPAGGVEPGEDLVAAASREVEEETGLRIATAPILLGSHDHDDGLGRPARSHFFRAAAPADVPDRWEHTVTGGADSGLVFLCRWEANPTLWPVQAVYLAQSRGGESE
jgi:8-oxo-dGTP pyrophosphatase MutT (NUDIX family)